MKELTKEQLAQEIKEHKQKMQLDFINDLLERVEHYAEKTIKTTYEASQEERDQFRIIFNIINNINKYL